MKNKMRFVFFTPITGEQLRNVQLLFKNNTGENFGYIINKMQDVKISDIQLTDPIKKENETFLIGIFTGYLGIRPSVQWIDKYGQRI